MRDMGDSSSRMLFNESSKCKCAHQGREIVPSPTHTSTRILPEAAVGSGLRTQSMRTPLSTITAITEHYSHGDRPLSHSNRQGPTTISPRDQRR